MIAHIRQAALIELGGMRRIVETSFMLVAVRMTVIVLVSVSVVMSFVVMAMRVVRMRVAMLIVVLFMPVIVRMLALVFVFMIVSHCLVPIL